MLSIFFNKLSNLFYRIYSFFTTKVASTAVAKPTNKPSPAEKEIKAIKIKDIADKLLGADSARTSASQSFRALNTLRRRNKKFSELLINDNLETLIDSAIADNANNINVNNSEREKALISKVATELINTNAKALEYEREAYNTEEEEISGLKKGLKEIDNVLKPSSYLSNFSHFFKYPYRLFSSNFSTNTRSDGEKSHQTKGEKIGNLKNTSAKNGK